MNEYLDHPERDTHDLALREYDNSGRPCPACGCDLWERWTTIKIGSDEWETVEHCEILCSCCDYGDDTYGD